MPRPPSVSPELLNTFVTVVRTEGDATRAAEILHVNQPSMSKRLAFLQHAGRILRRPWLERVGKSWHLTEEGRRVLPAVEELVHRYRLLAEAVEEERPAVVFGCGPSTAAGFVRPALAAFRAAHPSVGFRISHRPALDRVKGVGNGSLDVACVRLPPQEILEQARRPLYIDDLYDDPVVMAAVPGAPWFEEYRELSDKSVSPKLMSRLPLLLPDATSGLRQDFDRRCRDAGILDRLRVVIEAGPWTTLLGYIRDGVGVGLVPQSAVRNETGLTIKSLPPKLSPPNTVRVICRKRAGSDELDLTPEAMSFIDTLRDAAKNRL